MRDDELLPRPASDLVLLIDTPQGTPLQMEITPEQEKDWLETRQENEARRSSRDWQARRAEEARQKLIDGERTFNKHFWSMSEVLSWITYRCRAEMNTPHRRGTAYHLTQGSPKVEEAEAVPMLLDALQRPNNTLKAFADGVEISRATWGEVEYVNNPKRWPQGLFTREDVLREWPGQGIETTKPTPRNSSTPGTKPVKFEKTKAAMLADLMAGVLHSDEKQEALAKRYGVGRGVAVNAYRAALSEFRTLTNPDTD